MIGLALCPWAKPVHERGGVKIIHTGAKCPSELFGRVLEEMDLLAGGDAETSILVAPGVSAFRDSFPAFNDFVQDVEEYLREEGLDEEFQAIGFHPQFQARSFEHGLAACALSSPLTSHPHMPALAPVCRRGPSRCLQFREPVALPGHPLAATRLHF